MSDYSAYIALKTRLSRALSPDIQHKRTCVVPYHYSSSENAMYILLLVEYMADGSYVSTKPIDAVTNDFEHPWTTGMRAVFRHLGVHMKSDDRALFSSLASMSLWDGPTGTTYYFIDVYKTCPYLYDAIDHAHTHVGVSPTANCTMVSLAWEECKNIKGIISKKITDVIESLIPLNVIGTTYNDDKNNDSCNVMENKSRVTRWDS